MSGFAVILPSKTVTNLVPCVERILLQEPLLPAERIVIVDDGIEWNQEALELTQGCTVIRNERRNGKFLFARAVNLGIAVGIGMDCGCLIACNDDALLESASGFSLLASSCAANPDYGVIGATTNLTGQPAQRNYGEGLRTAPDIAFICVAIPKRTIDRIGLLDERFTKGYGCEDRDYCESVKRAGLKVGVHDGCFVDHSSLRSTYRGDPRASGDYSQNYRLLLEKWGQLTTA